MHAHCMTCSVTQCTQPRHTHACQPCRAELHRLSGHVRFYMGCATKFVDMLVFTSASLPAPFLAPAMAARVAEMLNYFLRHLTGPDRAKLRVSDSDQARCTTFCSLPLPAIRFT